MTPEQEMYIKGWQTAKKSLRQRRESTDEKAARLLTSGKLTVLKRQDDYILAQCQGDHQTYFLGWEVEDQRWYCSCPAHTDCSHLRALWLVTVNNNTGGKT